MGRGQEASELQEVGVSEPRKEEEGLSIRRNRAVMRGVVYECVSVYMYMSV